MSSQDHRHRHNRRTDTAVVPSLDLSSAEEAVLRAPFKHSLFAKVLGKRVDDRQLYAHLRSLWRPAGAIDFIPLARGFYLVNFSLPSDYDEVRYGFPWTIDDHYIVLLRWDPNFKPSEAIISLVAVWVRLPELQVQYYDEEILQKIGELIGEEVVKIDNCTRNRTKCKYARLCILIDLGKPVIPMIEIGGALQPIQYEGLHLLCYTCGRYGHRQHHCHHLASSLAEAIPELCFSGQSSTESLGFRHSSHLYGPWLQVRRGYQHQTENQVLQPEKKSVSLMYRPIKTAFIPCNNTLEHGEGTSGVAENIIGSSMNPQDQEASSSGHTDTVTSSLPSPSPALGDNPYVPVPTQSPEVPQTNTPTPSLGDLNVSTSAQTGTSSPSPASGDNPNVPVSSQPQEAPQTNTPTPSLGDLNVSTSAQTGTSSPSPASGDNPNVPVSSQPQEAPQTNTPTPSLGDLNVSTSAQTGTSSPSPALCDNPNVPVSTQPPEAPQTNTPTPSLGDLNVSTSAQAGTSSPSPALSDNPNVSVSTQPPEVPQTNTPTPSLGDLNVATSAQTGTSSTSPALADPNIPASTQPPEVSQTSTPPPPSLSNASGDPHVSASSQQRVDFPSPQNDSPTASVSTDRLPHQRIGAGITNQQQPPPEVIEFFSRVIQSLTIPLEINSSDGCITELVIEGKPQVITFDSKISNIEMSVDMSGLFTWNTNQHNVSFSTTVIDHTEYPVQKSSKKLLIWNCRGAGDAKLLPTVKALCQQHQPSAVLLLETRLSGAHSDQVIEDVGFSESLVVEPVGFTGGMWLLWRDNDIEMEVYSATPLHVAFEFLPKPETLILYGVNSGIGHEYSGVYGIDSSDSDHSSQTRSPEVFYLDQQIGPQTSHWIPSY
ncbi:uncharacterized protein LOC127801414 isoform X10 [Diospyros lotus]|uniref:uncharacterized protein LOC127801414 isoform X9 n=1 Tax=Diospyros lotus TaxID=55363 RepID=UPI002258B7F5|nr:uncharacterized protein LOC127801414 isoform X9 [Diospyros lotus]XP_052192514.1 uncharacterized protein LOC127801414 isoform X10 [Diospyros lotus]